MDSTSFGGLTHQQAGIVRDALAAVAAAYQGRNRDVATMFASYGLDLTDDGPERDNFAGALCGIAVSILTCLPHCGVDPERVLAGLITYAREELH